MQRAATYCVIMFAIKYKIILTEKFSKQKWKNAILLALIPLFSWLNLSLNSLILFAVFLTNELAFG